MGNIEHPSFQQPPEGSQPIDHPDHLEERVFTTAPLTDIDALIGHIREHGDEGEDPNQGGDFQPRPPIVPTRPPIGGQLIVSRVESEV
jgi:hypothetical protein